MKFWEGTKEGKLFIQFCKDCNSNIFYPRKFCPECWSGNLGWKQATGKATIYTFSTAYDMVEP
ncbi:MAG: zinc ribbon domain-containing protein, partial [Syntrophaceae bacterium]